MSTLNQQIKQLQSAVKKLETTASQVETIRNYAKTDGGRLNDFGKNMIHICLEANMSQSDIAKILDVTDSAISQQVAKMKNP